MKSDSAVRTVDGEVCVGVGESSFAHRRVPAPPGRKIGGLNPIATIYCVNLRIVAQAVRGSALGYC